MVVFERDPRARGASVRNFGMLWPIGQPFGPLRRLAESSLEIWLDVLESGGFWHERTARSTWPTVRTRHRSSASLPGIHRAWRAG